MTDDTRLRAALPTINKILGDGGSVILMSHLGRPKDGPEEKYSMKHVIGRLKSLLGRPVLFATDSSGKGNRICRCETATGRGRCCWKTFDFIRRETKGDEDFAEQLSRLGETCM